MTGHTLAGENAARVLTVTDRTRGTGRHGVTVGRAVGREVVALDGAGETLTDGRAGHVDLLAFREHFGSQGHAGLEFGDLVSIDMELFEQEMRVQAFQNSVFVAMCNRVGKEDAMDFAGESLVVDDKGTTLIKGSDRQELLYCNLDLNEIKKQTYLSLRRTSFYL